MKKLLFSALFLASIFTVSTAQYVKFGVKTGISNDKITADDLKLDHLDGDGVLSIDGAHHGFHFGIYTRIGKGFFIQPEVLFNSNRVDYSLTEGGYSQPFSEKYQRVDVPILFGMKLGPLRLNAGPVGHFVINSTSDLVHLGGYQQQLEKTTFGGQLGFGLNLGKHLTLDLRWENNLGKFGDKVTLFGEDYNFDKNHSRLLASVGYTF